MYTWHREKYLNNQKICNYMCTQHFTREVNFRKQQIQTSVNYPMFSSVTKKDILKYLQSHWKESQFYRFSRSTTQNFLRRSTMLVNIFEDFESPSKKFLATPLVFTFFSKYLQIMISVFFERKIQASLAKQVWLKSNFFYHKNF